MSLIKWIDLRDNVDKARLKIGSLTTEDGRKRSILFIVGLDSKSGRWQAAIDKLGFIASPKGKYLVRQVQEGEKLKPATFHAVWPNATLAEIPAEQVHLDLAATRRARESAAPRTQEESSAAQQFGVVTRLGRNAEGDEVFDSAAGRFLQQGEKRVFESRVLMPAMFLRAPDAANLDVCADGFVQAMLQGEVQHSDDLDRFIQAVTDQRAPYGAATYDRMAEVIDAAMVRFLNGAYETAQDAYGDAGRLYEYLPPYRGAGRGRAAMPLPMSVIAQRLLGDTAGKRVLVPNAWDGASFAFLAKGTQIHAFRGDKDLSRHVSSVREDEVTWTDRFDPVAHQGADGLFFNADPALEEDGSRRDYREALAALRALARGGRAVLVLAGDNARQPGELAPESLRFFEALGRRFDIEAAVEIGAELTRQVGTESPLRLIALRNRPASATSKRVERLDVLHSWDEVKAAVDEAIVSIDLREAESEAIDVERVARENEFQRPYVAFSKVGEARTMVPKNLQAPLQYALSKLEQQHGPIDQFVETELGFGPNTLGDRFSPEQVDAVGLGIARMKSGRGIIVGDETGIGKGRTLSALATWAEKQDRDVIFVTDRANLFSDLVRDLRDIEEWGRFRPFVMNADGVLMDVFTNQVLQQGTPPKVMNEVLDENKTLRQLGCNIVFATYSQIAGEDSPKADWLLQQSEQALVIVDEAHIAAGSDSNTSRVVTDLVNRAWAVAYSSATWAKSSENLHVYGRAFSETINVGSLAATMKTGGEPFSEVFSSMLARDGAFIRREHDLSKIEFVVEIDDSRRDRNSELSDKVAEILSAMTFVAGDINKMLVRLNSETVADLRRAREARGSLDVGALRRRGRRRVVEAEPGEQAENVAGAPPVGAAVADGAPVQPGVAVAHPAAAAAAAEDGQLQGEEAEAARTTARRDGFILKSHFGSGSVLYQVMRRFLAVLNADHVAELALRAVEQNRKPVIVFEDTGEAFVKRIIEQEVIPGIEGERAMLPEEVRAPTIKDLLRHVMKRMGVITKVAATEEAALNASERRQLATQRAEEEVDIEQVVQATDEAVAQGTVMTVLDLPGLTPEQQQDYRKGMERIMQMIDELPPLPLNAVDVVMMRLADAGLKVGEISGRKLRLVPPQDAWQLTIDAPAWEHAVKCKIDQRDTKKTAVNRTVYGFNNGELDAVCINRSAATGLSLHASPRFEDTRRRELVEMQIPENPTERIQLYGRVNRYDQIVTPKVSIATTGIYGEVRQLMQQNKKLARLSANIRSSRDNAAEIKFVPDLLNTVGEEVCRRFLEENGGIRNRLGITDKELEAPHFNAAQRLTSRVALLKVAEQKMVYEELYEMFADAINRYELAGENPLKPREMDLRAATKDQMIAIGVEMDGYGSAFDGPVYLKRIEWQEELKPIEWHQLVAMVNTGRQELVAGGFARWLDGAQVPVMDSEQPPPPDGADDHVPSPEAFAAPAVAVASSGVLPNLGFAPGVPEAPESQVRRIRYGDMVQHLVKILQSKMTIELTGSDFPNVQAALTAEKSNGVKRAYARKLWVEQKLPLLVPGCRVGLPAGKTEVEGVSQLLRTWGVVTALKPAPKGKEAMLSRWKVELVVAGDEKPRVLTLAALMEGCDVVSVTRNGMPAMDAVSDTIVDADIFGIPDAGARARQLPQEDRPLDDDDGGRLQPQLEQLGITWETVSAEVNYSRAKRDFESRNLERGLVKRKAMVMDGNMYLASEWAAATKQGRGIIYTDERGLRHRAILLNRNLGRHSLLLQHMPVRLWSAQMVSRFFERLLYPADGEPAAPKNWLASQGYVIPTEFKTAMKWLHGTSMEVGGTVVGIVPGKGIALLVEKSNLARTARALRGDQRSQIRRNHPSWNSFTEEQKQAAQAEMCTIRSTTKAKRGERPLVFLECETPRQFRNAVDLICRAAGVELYLPRGTALGELADRIQQDYFHERRREARAQLGLPEEQPAQPQPAAQEGLLEDAPLKELAQELGRPSEPPEAVGERDEDGDEEGPERERLVA